MKINAFCFLSVPIPIPIPIIKVRKIKVPIAVFRLHTPRFVCFDASVVDKEIFTYVHTYIYTNHDINKTANNKCPNINRYELNKFEYVWQNG